MSTVEPSLRGIVSPAARYAVELCTLYARVERPVVLVGPVGAGKTRLARRIHRLSEREGQLVELSAGELDESLAFDRLFGHVAGAFTGAQSSRRGALAEAAGGSLLIDDLALLSPALQASLLRVMESKRFRPLGGSKDEVADCRWIFASTSPLEDLVASGRLMTDLHSRVGELIVPVPALNERTEDIAPLAVHFAQSLLRAHEAAGEVVFADEVVALLTDYEWPQNIRELRNVVERAVVHAGLWEDRVHIRPAHLPTKVHEARMQGKRKPAEVSPEVVRYMLKQTEGNKAEAARRIGCHRNTVAKHAP